LPGFFPLKAGPAWQPVRCRIIEPQEIIMIHENAMTTEAADQ